MFQPPEASPVECGSLLPLYFIASQLAMAVRGREPGSGEGWNT